MHCRHHLCKEEVHEQFKLGDVLTHHHLDCMQTGCCTYEAVPAYTGERWKDFLNLDSPQREGRKPPPDRPSLSTEVINTDEVDGTTRLILDKL